MVLEEIIRKWLTETGAAMMIVLTAEEGEDNRASTILRSKDEIKLGEKMVMLWNVC